MRITTGMLNESSRRAGLPVNRTSLLNYVNGGNSGNSLVNALKSRKAPAVDTEEKKKYEKLEKSADTLGAQADKFTAKGTDSLLEKAKSSGDYTELYKEIENLVSNYNATFALLESASGTLNDFYHQSMNGLVFDYQEQLSSIGISLEQNGKLSLDSEKLKKADISTIEKALGSTGSFTSKLSYLAGRAEDNASVSARSVSNSYSTHGDFTDGFYQSRYNFWR